MAESHTGAGDPTPHRHRHRPADCPICGPHCLLWERGKNPPKDWKDLFDRQWLLLSTGHASWRSFVPVVVVGMVVGLILVLATHHLGLIVTVSRLLGPYLGVASGMAVSYRILKAWRRSRQMPPDGSLAGEPSPDPAPVA